MEYKWTTQTINIGWEIKKAMQAKQMTIKELARRAGIIPASMGAIMERMEIGTARLKHMSDLLEVNFFECYVDKKPDDGATRPGQEELKKLEEMNRDLENRIAELESRNKELAQDKQLMSDLLRKFVGTK